jgi:hypothetical protein
MKKMEICDLILDMVNNGELVMKDGRVYAPEHAPKDGIYVNPNNDIERSSDEMTEGNKK